MNVPCETEAMIGAATTPLTALDRCDRCGAQAYIRISRDPQELLFCVHHARESRVMINTMLQAGWVEYSESASLTGADQ